MEKKTGNYFQKLLLLLHVVSWYDEQQVMLSATSAQERQVGRRFKLQAPLDPYSGAISFVDFYGFSARKFLFFPCACSL